MKRAALLIAASLILAGCSGNQVTITNSSHTRITFHFRSEPHVFAPGETREVTGIPNGTFDYSTIYDLPSGVLSQNVTTTGDLGGRLNFYNWNTQIGLEYTNILEPDVKKDSSCVVDSTVRPSRSVCTVTRDTVWRFEIGASVSTSKPGCPACN